MMEQQTNNLEKILTKVILAKLQKQGILSEKQGEKIIQKY